MHCDIITIYVPGAEVEAGARIAAEVLVAPDGPDPFGLVVGLPPVAASESVVGDVSAGEGVSLQARRYASWAGVNGETIAGSRGQTISRSSSGRQQTTVQQCCCSV